MTLQRGRGLRSVNRVMGNDERTKIECVRLGGGTPAVCLSCTREDCVKPAEMKEQTRAATCNADSRLTLKRCALCFFLWSTRVFVPYL